MARKNLFIPEAERRYNPGGAMYCGAKNNTCKGLAATRRGLHVCTGHGANVKLGHGLKHGRYSKLLQGNRLARYEQYLRDPNRKDNLEAMALLQLMIDDDAEALQNNSQLWSDAKDSFNSLKSAMSARPPINATEQELERFREETATLIRAAIAELEVTLNNGDRDAAARESLRKNLDLQTKIKERDTRELVATRQVYFQEEVLAIIARNREIILRYVPADRKTDFEDEYSRAMGTQQLGVIG